MIGNALRTAAAGVVTAAIGASAASCGADEPANYVRLAISTDAASPSTFDRLDIEVSRSGNPTPYITKSLDFDAIETLPSDFTILENQAALATEGNEVIIRVRAKRGDEVAIARTARVAFGAGGRFIRMPLCASCAGVTCSDGETCRKGQCVDLAAVSRATADDPALTLTDEECPGPPPRCKGVCGTPGCGSCPEVRRASIPGANSQIDVTEVTRAAYEHWLSLSPRPGNGNVDPDCLSALDLVPDAKCSSDPSTCQDGCANHPQVCIPWCAAREYCRWTGGRLCAGIDGAHISPEQAEESEWRQACNGGDEARKYPYGTSYVKGACNDGGDATGGEQVTVEVSSLEACATPEGVFDLVGNVREWIDACDGEYCIAPGGDYTAAHPHQIDCDFKSILLGRAGRYPNVGFRCCAGP